MARDPSPKQLATCLGEDLRKDDEDGAPRGAFAPDESNRAAGCLRAERDPDDIAALQQGIGRGLWQQRRTDPVADHRDQRRQTRRSQPFDLVRPGALADRERLRAQSVSIFEEQDITPSKILRTHVRLLRQRIARMNRDDERLRIERALREVVPVERDRREDEIECAVTQFREQAVGLILDQHASQLRVLLAQAGQRLREKVGRDGWNDAEAQVAREGIGGFLRGGSEFVDRSERGACVWQQRGAFRCRHHPASRSFEEADSESRFELEQLRRESRLRDATRLRGATEVTVLGNGHPVFELAQRRLRR